MLNHKKVLAIIPARGGSKGVPNKNLRHVEGMSLLARTIFQAQQVPFIDTIVVSSEDEKILTAARAIDNTVTLPRPHELAQDDTSTADVILHVLSFYKDFDYLVALQVTSPLRTPTDITSSLQLCERLAAPACVSVAKAQESPFWMFSIQGNQQLQPLFNQPLPHQRQLCPTLYKLNGAIYIAKTDWFKQHRSFLSTETIGYEMSAERSLDIDTEADFAWLDYYLSNQKRLSPLCQN